MPLWVLTSVTSPFGGIWKRNWSAGPVVSIFNWSSSFKNCRIVLKCLDSSTRTARWVVRITCEYVCTGRKVEKDAIIQMTSDGPPYSPKTRKKLVARVLSTGTLNCAFLFKMLICNGSLTSPNFTASLTETAMSSSTNSIIRGSVINNWYSASRLPAFLTPDVLISLRSSLILVLFLNSLRM